jgi:hypothetical protein
MENQSEYVLDSIRGEPGESNPQPADEESRTTDQFSEEIEQF